MPSEIRTLPALTVWQPWASLIAWGCKPFEFRGWKPPASVVGQRIAIHCGVRPVKREEIKALLWTLQGKAWQNTGLKRDESIALLDVVLSAPGSLPRASVVCTATLGEPLRGRALLQLLGLKALGDSDRIEHSNWGWPLSDVRRLEPFQPYRGAQGLWRWPVPQDVAV